MLVVRRCLTAADCPSSAGEIPHEPQRQSAGRGKFQWQVDSDCFWQWQYLPPTTLVVAAYRDRPSSG